MVLEKARRFLLKPSGGTVVLMCVLLTLMFAALAGVPYAPYAFLFAAVTLVRILAGPNLSDSLFAKILSAVVRAVQIEQTPKGDGKTVSNKDA